jgi:hypothetical protein
MASPQFSRLSDGSSSSPVNFLVSRALPTRVLLLDTSDQGPVAKLLFDDGDVRGIVFTDAKQLDHPLFARLPPAHADELRQHVTNACRRGWATATPAGLFAVLSAGMNAGPTSYGAMVTGDCLLPDYHDGDVIVCDPDRSPKEGDFVAIWWKNATRLPSVKRLALSISGKDVEGGIVLEQLNPPHAFPVRMSDVEAIHKVIGKRRTPGQEA